MIRSELNHKSNPKYTITLKHKNHKNLRSYSLLLLQIITKLRNQFKQIFKFIQR